MRAGAWRPAFLGGVFAVSPGDGAEALFGKSAGSLGTVLTSLFFDMGIVLLRLG